MRIVAALGGNAFAAPGHRLTMAGQFAYAEQALTHLLPLLAPDVELLLVHGNGPQVGHMLIRVEQALGEAYALPLEVCVAESEGELGYVLQQTLYNLMHAKGVARPVASVLTQVVVDPEDPAFHHPTKPIGPAYDAERAAALEAEGFAVVKEHGRGFRRVVASPRPLRVVEQEVIEDLLTDGVLVIAAGGGGIPVVERGARLAGVDAVIDKDLAAALLADALKADLLVILTGVPCAYLRYGTPEQVCLHKLRPDEAQSLLSDGEFPPGSMGPKIEAAVRFLAAAPQAGRAAIICDPPTLDAALRGEAGTIITRNQEESA
ncbi:MAG: carbamate kinase [Myxococcales bacterium]|nr:carbamate kinase [Myxococcales bacterium]MCB9649661.1 carbamate kinase [Deltaproteobacteria bacterium]